MGKISLPHPTFLERVFVEQYIPSIGDLAWVISESPRGDLKFNYFYQGRATAQELSKVFFPNKKPDVPVNFPGEEKLISPEKFVEKMLRKEIQSGSDLIQKSGKDYLVSDKVRIERCADKLSGRSKDRPAHLPYWSNLN